MSSPVKPYNWKNMPAGGIIPERTGTMDRDDVAAEVVQEPFIQAQLDGLAGQDPEPADLNQAIFVVQVDPLVIGSGTVTVTDGGGLVIPTKGGAVTIVDSEFVENYASDQGGGVWASTVTLDMRTRPWP